MMRNAFHYNHSVRHVFLALCLSLVACGPRGEYEAPAGVGLIAYSTITPSATPEQPVGLVLSNETPLSTATPFTYTVKAGDTLSAIAEQFRVSLDDLRAANPDVSPTGMSIGTLLHIPSNPSNPGGDFTPTPAPLRVRQIECFPTADRGLWCFILVHNDGPETLENVSAQVSLLDINDEVLASQTALLPLNILRPTTSLALATFFEPVVPGDASARVQILTAVRLPPDDERYLPVSIDSWLAQVNWSGHSAQVTGEVLLAAGSDPAREIWVAGTAYDTAGRVAGVRRWASTEGLTPGGKLPFAFVVSSLGTDIQRVELAVEARP